MKAPKKMEKKRSKDNLLKIDKPEIPKDIAPKNKGLKFNKSLQAIVQTIKKIQLFRESLIKIIIIKDQTKLQIKILFRKNLAKFLKTIVLIDFPIK